MCATKSALPLPPRYPPKFATAPARVRHAYCRHGAVAGAAAQVQAPVALPRRAQVMRRAAQCPRRSPARPHYRGRTAPRCTRHCRPRWIIFGRPRPGAGAISRRARVWMRHAPKTNAPDAGKGVKYRPLPVGNAGRSDSAVEHGHAVVRRQHRGGRNAARHRRDHVREDGRGIPQDAPCGCLPHGFGGPACTCGVRAGRAPSSPRPAPFWTARRAPHATRTERRVVLGAVGERHASHGVEDGHDSAYASAFALREPWRRVCVRECVCV